MFEKIIKNAVECVKCHEVIESTHVHDFRFCKCGTIFVDGGKEYLRRGGDGMHNIVEKCEVVYQPAAEYLVDRAIQVIRAQPYGFKGFIKRAVIRAFKDAFMYSVIVDIMIAVRVDAKLTLGREQTAALKAILEKELVGDKK